MRALNFKLRTLLLGIAVISIVCATIFTSSMWWARVLDVLVWCALVVAVVAASVGSGASRHFGLGFAIAAGLYVPMAFTGSLSFQRLPGPHVVADEIARSIQRAIAPSLAKRLAQPGFEPHYENESWIRTGPRSVYDIWQSADWQRTQRSIHCAMTLLLGCLGGALALRFHSIQANGQSKRASDQQV